MSDEQTLALTWACAFRELHEAREAGDTQGGYAEVEKRKWQQLEEYRASGATSL